MRLACVFLLLLFAASAFAQSRLAIDKIDRKNLIEASKEVPYSALLEGTVDNPDLNSLLLHLPEKLGIPNPTWSGPFGTVNETISFQIPDKCYGSSGD